jgi:ABC-type sugar transport system, ATPase component
MVLEMRGISKSFPGVKALDNVSLTVGRGEIHAVVGENGAGKSTLMNILAGALERDQGSIRIDGQEVEITDTLSARQLGIGIIYQHLNMVPDLTVAENLSLSAFPVRGGRLDAKAMREQARQRLARLRANIDPDARLGSLSIADQQLVAISRAITPETRILIMDEPTSSLTPSEVDGFFHVVKGLRSAGVSIIFISHHLEEIFSITDRITVLRDGKLIGDWNTRDMTEAELVHAMAGRSVGELFPKVEVTPGDTVMEVRNLASIGEFSGVDFSVRAGEIVGIGGLVGAGRSEILKTIFGDLPRSEGSVFLGGNEAGIRHPRDAVAHGIAYIPEDRGMEGLVLSASLVDNITLPRVRHFLGRWRLDSKAELAESTRLSTRLGVKTPGMTVPAANLSGGNQQKVALAKWFGMQPKVLLLDEPTRGIDIGAKADIYRLMGQMASEGVAIVMVTSELPELLAISDKIIVMCKGRQAAVFSRGEATAESVMLAATGGSAL